MWSRLLCLSAVMFFGVCGLVSSQEVPFRDDLRGTWDALRTFCWKIPDAGVRSAGDSIEITASGGERRIAHRVTVRRALSLLQRPSWLLASESLWSLGAS